MKIRWLDVTEQQEEALHQALALYERSFPDEVREPDEVLLRGLTRRESLAPGAFHLLLALDEENQVVALSTAHFLAEFRFGFVVYLVVDAQIQGQGLGGQVLAKMESLLQQDAEERGVSLRGMILETEREVDATTAQEQKESRRRSRFFQRQGYGRVQDVYYLQPPLRETTSAVPLHLFVKLLENGAPALRGGELLYVVLAMYREKYGKINRVPLVTLQRCFEELRIPEEELHLEE